jgi:SPOR domain
VTPPAQASAPPAAAPPAAPVAQQALRPAQNPPPPSQAAAQPAPKPAVPTKLAAVTPAAKPRAEKPKPEKPAEKSAAPTAKPGAAAVQIGAVSSTQLADKTWTDAVAVAPGLAAGKGKGVEKVDKDGKVLYRTSVTGFASKAEAAAFCDKLKAAGKACFVK